MSPVEIALLALGGNAMLMGALAYLAKSLLSQMLTKDLKRFESSLSEASNVAAEQLKHRLSMVALEHNVRFTRLHEKQAKVLEDIYERLLAFEDASALLALASDSTPESRVEPALRAAERAGAELQRYVRHHEIFLPVATSDNLAALLEQIFTLLGNCSFNLLTRKLSAEGTSSTLPETQEAWAQVHAYLEHEAPAVRRSVEMEFRRLLGTEVGGDG